MKNELIKQIEQYQPYNEQEEQDKEVMLRFLREGEDVFSRKNTIAHFTASAWVISTDRTSILMAYHNLYDSWSWLGGHADGDEDLLRVALKEVKEESGIQEVSPLSKDIYSLEILTVDGHEKKGHYVSSHLHMNVTYLLEADKNQEIHKKEDENSAVGWFLIEEAVSKSSEPWFRDHIYNKLNQKLVTYLPSK